MLSWPIAVLSHAVCLPQALYDCQLLLLVGAGGVLSWLLHGIYCLSSLCAVRWVAVMIKHTPSDTSCARGP
jgi:hypothetical protein